MKWPGSVFPVVNRPFSRVLSGKAQVMEAVLAVLCSASLEQLAEVLLMLLLPPSPALISQMSAVKKLFAVYKRSFWETGLLLLDLRCDCYISHYKEQKPVQFQSTALTNQTETNIKAFSSFCYYLSSVMTCSTKFYPQTTPLTTHQLSPDTTASTETVKGRVPIKPQNEQSTKSIFRFFQSLKSECGFKRSCFFLSLDATSQRA